MPDIPKTPKRNVGDLRRKLAVKRKASVEPAPVAETLASANKAAVEHIQDGVRERFGVSNSRRRRRR